MAMETEKEFWGWEKTSLDTIDFKKIYADIAEDVVAGLLLSQIIYWNLPEKNNPEKSKLRVRRGGKWHLVKSREDWWEECRISPRQVDRCLKILKDKKIVETEVHKFGELHTPTTFIHLKMDVFLPLLNKQQKENEEKEAIKEAEKEAVNNQMVISDVNQEGTLKLTKKAYKSYQSRHIKIDEQGTSFNTKTPTKTPTKIPTENTSCKKQEKEKSPLENNHLKDDKKKKDKKINNNTWKLDKSNIYNEINSLFINNYNTTTPENLNEFIDFLINNVTMHVNKNNRLTHIYNTILTRWFKEYKWENIEKSFKWARRELETGNRDIITVSFLETNINLLIQAKVIDKGNYYVYICGCKHETIIDDKIHTLEYCLNCNLPINHELMADLSPKLAVVQGI